MPCSDNPSLALSVGARPSPLSRAQVKEILEALQEHHPYVCFNIHYLSTVGDRDQKTSLRTLGRTDFFTKDIDEWVLEGPNRLGIHSAKDLPSTLAAGLALFCLTRGLDSSDTLVLRPRETLSSLAAGARIATSSIRREEMVRQLRNDLSFCDLRGTIEERLSKLETGEADGVVIAEAALIRLRLTYLNRIRLPGPTVEGQGQLAVVGRQEDQDIKYLFACLDVKQNSSLLLNAIPTPKMIPTNKIA
jgi:hydroxymethylbilane synthase